MHIHIHIQIWENLFMNRINFYEKPIEITTYQNFEIVLRWPRFDKLENVI